ncbi:MAG: hypothetical protein MUE94_10185 [Verrucomicrobia bacterium]|nr:hypothetical protein [Verrucomicrobiota bacterium]
MLRHIRDADRHLAELEAVSENGKARRAALDYEDALEDRYRNDPSFKVWDSNRALDFQDFDYLFQHRCKFGKSIRTHLEIIAAKLTHVGQDDEDGYFNKLERNVGWKGHITPLVFSEYAYADKVVRCGMWTHAKNSRRCHKSDVCPLCLWNDILKVRSEAFGQESGTFERMQGQGLTAMLITLGYTTQPANSKSVGRDFDAECLVARRGNPQYDPYPVCLGFDDDDTTLPYLGYVDARFLGMIAQEAIEQVYNDKLLAGYFFKLEAKFKIVPNGANRVNIHAHIVANGPEDNAQFLADILFKHMRRGLRRYRKHMHSDYHPDVLVERLKSAAHLETCICYSEKIIPIGRIVEEAMAKPGAKRSDGSWDQEYVSEVRTALTRLVNDDIPATLTTLKLEKVFHNLRRRKTVGNFSFNDRGTCIGAEPAWHKKVRREKSKRDRKARLKRKQRALSRANKGSAGRSAQSRQKAPRNAPRRSRSARKRPTRSKLPAVRRDDPTGPTATANRQAPAPQVVTIHPTGPDNPDACVPHLEVDAILYESQSQVLANVNKSESQHTAAISDDQGHDFSFCEPSGAKRSRNNIKQTHENTKRRGSRSPS